MPHFYPITIVVLKFVMIIVVTFAKGEERKQERISCAAPGGIWLASERMTGAVDEEGAMLNYDYPRNATN